MHRISLSHNFETAHRLSHPDAPLKCQSIHGHSWWVTVTLEGDTLDEAGMLVEFGAFKRAWRALLDDELDHHLVLAQGDPMIEAILSVQPEARLRVLPFDPTTELLSRWIFARTEAVLATLPTGGVDARVARVHLHETRVNAAEYER